MEYRYLGRTGLQVSPLCLGTMQMGWLIDEEASFRLLSAAYDRGINFIDTADIYSRWAEGNPGGVAETIIGRWWRQAGIPRDRLVIATKVRGPMGEGPNTQGLSRKHIMDAVHASLRRLQTDYIDLYQMHWYDANTPIEETLRTLDDLVRQGKVRYIGVSNYPAWRLMEALWVADKRGYVPFVSLQPHYNLLHREEFERELMDVCRTYGLGVIPYSPLARGFLTGKYRRGQEVPREGRAATDRTLQRYLSDPKYFDILEQMEAMARAKGCTLTQLALAWLLANPVVTSPIIGPRTIEQLEDNLGALEVRLTPEELETLNALTDWRGEA